MDALTIVNEGIEMGACDFSCVGEGKSAAEAFAEAKRRAQYENGHGGYTGTIAEKDKFVVIESSPMEGKAGTIAARLLDNEDSRISDKWGPAGAIRIDGNHWLFFGWASS